MYHMCLFLWRQRRCFRMFFTYVLASRAYFQGPRDILHVLRLAAPTCIWLVVYLPLWKIWKSVGVIISNIWKNKHNPNHQPDFGIDFRNDLFQVFLAWLGGSRMFLDCEDTLLRHLKSFGDCIEESLLFLCWLVVYLPLWEIWKSVEMIIPNMWKVIKFMFQTTNQSVSLAFLDLRGLRSLLSTSSLSTDLSSSFWSPLSPGTAFKPTTSYPG